MRSAPRAVRVRMIDDPTFAYRVVLGVGVLVALATRDRVRSGTASRFRELGFLFAVAVAAMAYAVLHDAATWSLAPAYFAIGKGIPAAEHSFAPVADLALRGGWTAGLAIALVLLVANNPAVGRPQLSYRVLASHAAFVWVGSIGAALLCAAVGLAVAPWVAEALGDAGVASPNAYATVQGAHVGTYAGAFLACVVAVARIRCARCTHRTPSSVEDL